MSIADLFDKGEEGSFMQPFGFSCEEKTAILNRRPDAYFSEMLDENGDVLAETVNFPKVTKH